MLPGTPMTALELAEKLNGRAYRHFELSRDEAAAAKAAGLVVVTGYSDDGASFYGAIHDEVGASNGARILLTGAGLLKSDCDCEDCPYFKKLKDTAMPIKAVWGQNGYDWSYETAIPHVTFDVVDGNRKFSRALVFALADVRSQGQELPCT